MKKILKNTIFFLLCMFMLPNNTANSNVLNDYSTQVLKMQMKEKKMKILLDETLIKISEKCCEDNFEEKDRVLEIKANIIKCLNSEDKKCFKGFLLYVKKPEKLIILNQVEEVEKLLLENKRQKYENSLKADELALQKSSQDFETLKKSNDKLKKRITISSRNS